MCPVEFDRTSSDPHRGPRATVDPNSTRYSQQEIEALIEEFTGERFMPDPDWVHVNVDIPIPGTCLVCGKSDCGPADSTEVRSGILGNLIDEIG